MIHQVFISDMVDDKENVQLEINKNKFLEIFPHEEYKLWREKDIKIFMAKEYPAVLKSFNQLTAYAAKADLAKILIVNHFGGWYYDFYTEPLVAINPSDFEMIFFRDRQEHTSTSFAVAVNIFYSIKNNPVLQTAIDLIMDNIKNKHYGINPLCPTSVVPFGRAVATHGENIKHKIGDYKEINGKRVNAFPDGQIMANGKQLDGGHIAIAGTNNYNELWRDRNFYGEKLDK